MSQDEPEPSASPDEEPSFFWLLSQQRAAALEAKDERRDAQGVQQAPIEPKTAAGALLRALASGTQPADVPQQLASAAGEALLSVLGAAQTDEPAVAEAVARCGIPVLLQALLELGADATGEQQGSGNVAPLVAALAGGHFEAACLLLDAGAPPDLPASPATPAEPAGAAAAQGSGRQAAADEGAPRTPKRQHKSGAAGGQTRHAEPRPSSSSERSSPKASSAVACPTPLVLAVLAGSLELAKRLVAAGADVNRQCAALLPGAPAPAALTPLVAAVHAAAGSKELLEMLIEAGADVHQKCCLPGSSGVDWTSPLTAAVLAGKHSLVSRLVSAGACAPRNAGGRIGRDHPALRAVVLAAQHGQRDAVASLYPRLVPAVEGGHDAVLGILGRRTILHPLAAAAEKGQLAVVQQLLELGAPADHGGSSWVGVHFCTPLMLAVANGHVAVLDCLLAAGADPLKANSRGEMAATLALQRGQLAAALRLLEHTGELSPASGEGHAGQQGPQLENASRAWRLGWSLGEPAGSKGRIRRQGQEEAEQRRYEELLLAQLQVHRAGSNGGSGHSSSQAAAQAAARLRELATPASLARAAAGSLALLDALLAAGVSISCVNPSDGSFPLMAAAHFGWPAMERLLQRCAPPNQADPRGVTALIYMAARPSMLEATEQLLDWRRAQQEQREEREQQEQREQAEQQVEQQGPAEQQGQQQDVQQQQAGQQQQVLDVLQPDVEGRDAVGVALAARNAKFAKALLEHLVITFAPPSQRHKIAELAPAVAGQAYDLLAKRPGYRRLSDINRVQEGGRHLLWAQIRKGGGRKQLRRTLALPGLDANVRCPATGRTPLLDLAARRLPLLVEELLATGRADLEVRDASGATALLLAASAADGAVLRLLLGAGADVACADHQGRNVLIALALAQKGQHRLMEDVLHCPGGPASIDATDSSSWSALHHAAAAGHFNACRVLRVHGADLGLRTAEGKTAEQLAQEGGHAACLPLLRVGAAAAAAAAGGAQP